MTITADRVSIGLFLLEFMSMYIHQQTPHHTISELFGCLFNMVFVKLKKLFKHNSFLMLTSKTYF